MRGVSARSLDQVLARVDTEIDAGADAGGLGDELFDVVALLDAESRLRRMLTDPSTETSAQEALVRKVLQGKVGAPTLEVIAVAVAGRWSSSHDLSDGLEQAGVAAHVVGAEKRGRLHGIEEELFRFGRVVESHHELRQVLTDRTIPAGAKQKLVQTLVHEKVGPHCESLIKQAVRARTAPFASKLAYFGELAAARRNRLVATARSAYPLGDDEVRRLGDALGHKYGREVHVNSIVDRSVIGGLSVEIGEEIIDGTVASRLEDARRRMAG